MKYEFIDPAAQIESDAFGDVESFLRTTGRTQIGWHYITDLTWLYSHIRRWPSGLRILDAGGGGSGPLQFLLAELGHHVTNLDLYFPALQPKYQRRYGTRLRKLPSHVATDYVALLDHAPSARARQQIRSRPGARGRHRQWPACRRQTPAGCRPSCRRCRAAPHRRQDARLSPVASAAPSPSPVRTHGRGSPSTRTAVARRGGQ